MASDRFDSKDRRRQLGERHGPTGDRGEDRSTAAMTQMDVVLKAFEDPDEHREFAKGFFDVVRIGGMAIGRATYEPGWKWSVHVGPGLGQSLCSVEHVGMVVSGTAAAAFEDGRVVLLKAGDLFHIPALPHDSWVVGDEPYVSIHFLGVDQYARGRSEP